MTESTDGVDRSSDHPPTSLRTPELPVDQGAAPGSGAPDPVDVPGWPGQPKQPPGSPSSQDEMTAPAARAADGPVSLVKADRPPVSGAAADIPTARPAEPADETPPVQTDPDPAVPPQSDPPQSDPPPPGRPLGRPGVLPLALVGLLTALMVAGVAFLGLHLRAEAQTETAREEAVAASRDAARVLFSYDHARLDEDFAKGLSVTTGAFRDEYARTTEQVVTDVARQYKAVVVADVVESAVVEDAPREVTTLVFLNQATTSTQIQGRQVDQSRVRMRLVEQDGRWLVAEVQAL